MEVSGETLHEVVPVDGEVTQRGGDGRDDGLDRAMGSVVVQGVLLARGRSAHAVTVRARARRW